MLEVQQATVDMAGASRLEQIRASMHGNSITGGEKPTTQIPAAPQTAPQPQQQPGTA